MNYLEVLLAAGSKNFRRKGWSKGLYCFVSDLDFCVYIATETIAGDEAFNSKKDMLENDWEVVE